MRVVTIPITGLAKSLGLNPLLSAMVMGIVTTNKSMMHRLIYVEMRQAELNSPGICLSES